LKNSYASDTSFFKGGKFEIEDFDAKLSNSLSSFIKDINTLERLKLPYKIYVSGSADITGENTFEGNLESNKMITVHKHLKNNVYQKKSFQIEVPQTFKNKHLPILRADYMHTEILKYLASNSSKSNMEILEGRVIQKKGDAHRNASFYLYIEDENWNK